MTKRVLLGVVVVGMVAFAAEGGEYGTVDLLRLKGQVRREQEAIVRLRTEVDSLTRVERASLVPGRSRGSSHRSSGSRAARRAAGSRQGGAQERPGRVSLAGSSSRRASRGSSPRSLASSAIERPVRVDSFATSAART